MTVPSKRTRTAGIDVRRPKKPFLRGLSPTLHISHRGGAGLAPENTLAAFRMATSQYRTDMLELDVQLTADGRLVVSHDPTVDRCTNGRGAIRELTWADLKRLDAGFRFTPDGRSYPFRDRGVAIPTLTEVLEEFDSLRLNIDVKCDEPNVEDLFADTLRKSSAVDRVCCGSESDELAARLVKALPEACHFFPRDAAANVILSIKSGESLDLPENFYVLDIPLEFEGLVLVDEELVSAASELGLWINVWTIDDQPTMEKLVKLGVGGIMTDRPDRLRAILDRSGSVN